MPSYAVTGASRGLGLEWISQLSNDPTNTVFALVRNPSTATKLTALASSRPNIHVVQGDVTKPAEVVAAAETIGQVTGGTLDVLIHNALGGAMEAMALSPSQYPIDAVETAKAFDEVMAVTVYGGLWITNAVLPLIEKGEQKKIVHISSGIVNTELIVKTGMSYGVQYAVAKAGLNIVVAKYAAELAEKGIKVLALSPGWVDTAEGPLPPHFEAFFKTLLLQFQKVEPGLKGPITREDSVRMQLEVVDRLDEEMSGKFLSHHGDTNWF